LALAHIHQQPMLLKKIHAQDRELDGRQEETPGKMLAVKG
jgi:hypothetical protein